MVSAAEGMHPTLKAARLTLMDAYDALLEAEDDPHGILDADDSWGELAAKTLPDLACDTGEAAVLQFGRWQRWLGQAQALENSERDNDWDLASAYGPALVVAFIAARQAIQRETTKRPGVDAQAEAEAILDSWVSQDEPEVEL